MATSTNRRKPSSSSYGGDADLPPAPPPPSVKFTRRTSSGRVMSLSRDEELDIPDDYSSYTVMMPPTPDNQPGAASSSGDKPDGPTAHRAPSSRFRHETPSQPGRTEGGGGDSAGKLDRRMSILKNDNKSMLLRSQTQDFDHNRWLFETKGKYGIGNAFWQDEDSYDHETGMSMQDFIDKPWKPLTRKVHVPPGVISPYR